jgi:hypothetical protein
MKGLLDPLRLIRDIGPGPKVRPQHEPKFFDPLSSDTLQHIVLIAHQSVDPVFRAVCQEDLRVHRLRLVHADNRKVHATLVIRDNHRRVCISQSGRVIGNGTGEHDLEIGVQS